MAFPSWAAVRRLGVMLLLYFLGVSQPGLAAQEPARIGFVIDGPWERNDEIRGIFEREIRELLGREFVVQFPVTLVADWTPPGVRRAVDSLFQRADVDIAVTLGVIASADAARRESLPKPVIAPFVLDIGLAGIPLRDGASGVPNLTYVAVPDRVGRDIEAFGELARFESLVVLMNARFVAALPEMGQGAAALAARFGIAVSIVPVDNVAEALAAAGRGDAVYLAPLIHLPPGELQNVIDGINALRLPSFSLFGESEVQRGVLAGLSPETFWLRIARRTALNAQRILLGEEASAIPVAFPHEEQLTINMATARMIGVFPPWSVLTEATLINEDRTQIERRLNLALAVQEAVTLNLDLAAQDRLVAAGAQDVRAAWARLFPQVDVSAQATVIDEDRAAASFGSQAQRTLTGTATLSQLLFSERAWANTSIQHRLQRVREYERDALELDIAHAASVAYLNVLRGNTFERIQRENLQMTRSNLDLARVRVEVGAAGPGEVFRLESQIATDRRNVIAANSRRNQAEIALNRLLHRPLEEPFATEEVVLEDIPLVGADRGILRYIDNPYAFRVFRAFMVEEALAASPELGQLDAAIAAQQRVLSSARNAFWTPTVAVQAGITNLFSEGGAGTTFDPMLPPGGIVFPQANDLSWSVGVRFSLPVFLGGERFANTRRAAEDLASLRFQRAALAERIEQGVRSALHAAGASFASIDLARAGADAANRSLDIVIDAYSRGVAGFFDLLDAQNTAVIADLVAANAVYDFLVDLADVERAVGRFQLLAGAESRADFFRRLAAYFVDAGLAPRR